jgi:hypothetical protein
MIAALATMMPTADPAAICQPAKSAALPEDRAAAYQSCVHDEQAARDQLRKRWGQYAASARAVCAQPSGVPQSYVELLTCLEMQTGGNFTFGAAPSLNITPAGPAGAQGAPAAKP